jgi:hypothetical protein
MWQEQRNIAARVGDGQAAARAPGEPGTRLFF